jgi:predicted restriction endonuclease
MVELSTPVRPGTTDNIQNVTQIPNIRLGQFPSLTMEQHFAVAGFFVTPDRDIENVNDQAESVVAQRLDIGDTERSALIKARRGQGIFRENVLLIEQCCRVTGLAIVEHLRASHIKPWRVSTDLEKLDGYNGLLLSPHVDHLFDRGWITFTRDGFLKPSPSLDPVVLSTWRIEPKRVVEPFSDRHQEYLEYHREAVFHE